MRTTDAADGHYELMPGLFDEATDWTLRSEVYSDCALASIQLTGAERRATRAEYQAKYLHVEGDTP